MRLASIIMCHGSRCISWMRQVRCLLTHGAMQCLRPMLTRTPRLSRRCILQEPSADHLETHIMFSKAESKISCHDEPCISSTGLLPEHQRVYLCRSHSSQRDACVLQRCRGSRHTSSSSACGHATCGGSLRTSTTLRIPEEDSLKFIPALG